MSFEVESAVYREHLLEMLGVNYINEGKYAVIRGQEIQGPFSTYEDALGAGYENHGLEPFMVKKIERNERVLHFSRAIG
jgi:hypothetical protein